jgi:oxygen-independent coproporphyrinogen-3 oxidase
MRTAFAERNVPRYTSYPTAPHFTAAVGSDTYLT